jgi:hypothetical protein
VFNPKIFVAGTVLSVLASTSFAQDSMSRSTVGNFIVLSGKEPISDKANVIAMIGQQADIVGVRCLDDGLSIAVMRPSEDWTTGDPFEIKFRADGKPVIAKTGAAISPTVIEIPNAEEIIDNFAGAKTVVFRVISTASTYTFTLQLRESDRAVNIVKKACAQ